MVQGEKTFLLYNFSLPYQNKGKGKHKNNKISICYMIEDKKFKLFDTPTTKIQQYHLVSP